MTTIIVTIDHIFLDTKYKQPTIHQHLAKHIIISLSDSLLVTFDTDETFQCEGIIIGSNVPHTVASTDNRMLVILVDDTSALAKTLDQHLLHDTTFAQIDSCIVGQIRKAYGDYSMEVPQSYTDFFNQIFFLLGLDYYSAAITDSRIQWALSHILSSTQIDNSTIAELCAEVNLSQSRFSHLFKEQTRVSLNSYLALSKLRKAYEGLLKSGDITKAAMDAGFSTPSHFAASSKKYLGIAASELTGQCRIYFIHQ